MSPKSESLTNDSQLNADSGGDDSENETPWQRTVTIDGVEYSLAVTPEGRPAFCGDTLTEEGAQLLQELIFQCRIAADGRRQAIKRAKARRENEEHFA